MWYLVVFIMIGFMMYTKDPTEDARNASEQQLAATIIALRNRSK